MRVSPLLCLFVGACGAGDDEDAGPVAGVVTIMPDVISTLPSFVATGGTPRAVPAVGDPITDRMILDRFKLECHAESLALQNDCPAGVPLDMSTKYSTDTVLGLIAGAAMFANEILGRASLGTCDVNGRTTAAHSVTLASFVADSAGGEGARYFVNELSRIGCVGDLSPTRHAAWAIPDGTRRETITFAKGEPSGTSSQALISQSVVTLDVDGTPRAIALNDVNLTIHTSGVSNSRAVVVANLKTRRFLVRSSGGPAVLGVAAAGQGGLTPAGSSSPGQFYAVSNEGPGNRVCVDNATKLEAAGCAIESAAWTGGMTAAAYLELTPEDAAVFAGYLAVFADGPTASQLPTASVPAGAGDLIHFPDRIQ